MSKDFIKMRRFILPSKCVGAEDREMFCPTCQTCIEYNSWDDPSCYYCPGCGRKLPKVEEEEK